MKQFKVPPTYRSPLISAIKQRRKEVDKLKKDFTPTRLDMGPLQILLARHFGFCYGVENAIEIAFETIRKHPDKRLYLLSEMIHNPQVNEDLKQRGIQFIQDTNGKEIIPFDTITSDDVVIIPAFGTTLAIEKRLKDIGIKTEQYNTTCPFVEKVWNRSEQIAQKKYSVIIHGKPTHEETRATFSHAAFNAPTIVVNDMKETILLGKYITGEKNIEDFYTDFSGRYSNGFDIQKDLQRFGVVNQTTMLASDTQAIADYLKELMINHYQLTEDTVSEKFAETRDTLCYATNDNQSAVYGLLKQPADLAIVVGGYNSSNTSHLVELCEEKLPTYFIDGEQRIQSQSSIEHFNFHKKESTVSTNFLPNKKPLSILLTSGASCPDTMVENVIKKLVSFYTSSKTIEDLTKEFEND